MRLPYKHTCILTYAKYLYMYAYSWTEGGAKLAGCGCRARNCEACSERQVAQEFWFLAAFRLQDATEECCSSAVADWLGCPGRQRKSMPACFAC